MQKSKQAIQILKRQYLLKCQTVIKKLRFQSPCKFLKLDLNYHAMK